MPPQQDASQPGRCCWWVLVFVMCFCYLFFPLWSPLSKVPWHAQLHWSLILPPCSTPKRCFTLPVCVAINLVFRKHSSPLGGARRSPRHHWSSLGCPPGLQYIHRPICSINYKGLRGTLLRKKPASAIYNYRTRVRSLAMFVTHSLTHWLTH